MKEKGNRRNIDLQCVQNLTLKKEWPYIENINYANICKIIIII
jgi:hypothetical protein